ncbi:MAG: hypothetical protein ABIQ88_22230 [Chitinophagaceae bacterium]
MKKTIKDVRKLLKEIKGKRKNNKAAFTKANNASPTGCCQITLDGSTSNKSGLTKRECEDATNNFPGATCVFTPGVSCRDV